MHDRCRRLLLDAGARRQDAPFVRAQFDSSATHTVVHAAACSFDAASTFDGQDHVFDVHVGGERCPNRAFDARAIPLFVWLRHGDADRVVVEAIVPASIDANKLQTAVTEITGEIRRRVERASSAPPPTVIAPVTTYSHRAMPYAWTPESNPSWYRPRYKRADPALMAGGIFLVAVGPIAMFGGAISALSSNGCCGNSTPGLVISTLGLVGLVAGIPMLVIGAKKIPNVSASVSPTGGSLRVTF